MTKLRKAGFIMNNVPNDNLNVQGAASPTVTNTENPLSVQYEKKNVYTLTHAVFALLALVLGSLWYRWFFVYYPEDIFGSYHALGKTVFTLAFSAFAFVFYRMRKNELSGDSLFLLITMLVFSLRFAFYPTDTDSFISFLASLVLHILALLFMQSMGDAGTLDRIVGSTFKAVVAAPFLNFHTLFASFSAFFKVKRRDDDKERAKKIGTGVGFVFLGIFIALPILAVVASLLSSDSFFANFIGDIVNFFDRIEIDFNIGEYFNIITILVSLYIFGALYCSDKKRTETPETPQSYSFIPATVSKTVFIVLFGVYALFIAAQLEGFGCMLLGKLPDGVTYASFARSGFFELCAVACINGAVLYISDILTLRKSGEKRKNLIQIILVYITFFIIFTAAAKMIMYITAYGFTPKRFYTLWFMLLLAILFSLALVKLRKAEFRLSRYSVYVTCTMLIVLFFVDFEWLSDSLNAIYFNSASVSNL